MKKTSNFKTALHKQTTPEVVLFIRNLSDEERDQVRVDCEAYCEEFLQNADGGSEILAILDGKLPELQELPPLDLTTHGYEKDLQFSIYVLVRLYGWHIPTVARYVARDGYWEVTNLQGKIYKNRVLEWWPIPTFGTGTIPPY